MSATLSYALPQTQNTAPVIEHRCLYTHDLSRKKKRWQDGYMRFHTFNNRVMVYDVPRNYVGDTYWREKQPVQDGDEFELERGVLIQVAEEVGKIDQDISDILKKRDKAPDIRINVDRAAPALAATPKPTLPSARAPPSIPSIPSQPLRPKSLNAVLGTPKGSIGRAVLPTKSPYEQRNGFLEQAGENGRSSKRQRVQMPFERLTVLKKQEQNISRLEEARSLQENVSRGASPATEIEARKTATSKSVDGERSSKTVNNMSHGVSSLGGKVSKAPSKTITRKALDTNERCTESIHIVSSQEDDPPDIISRQRLDKIKKKRKATDKAKRETQAVSAAVRLSQTNNIGRPTHLHTATIESPQLGQPKKLDSPTRHRERRRKTRDPSKKLTRLQIAPSRPRKKLMYRELLPPEIDSMPLTSHQLSQSASTSSTHTLCKRQKKKAAPSLSSLHQYEQDRLDGRLEKTLRRNVLGNAEITIIETLDGVEDQCTIDGSQYGTPPPETFVNLQKVDEQDLTSQPRMAATPDYVALLDEQMLSKSHKEPMIPQSKSPLSSASSTYLADLAIASGKIILSGDSSARMVQEQAEMQVPSSQKLLQSPQDQRLQSTGCLIIDTLPEEHRTSEGRRQASPIAATIPCSQPEAPVRSNSPQVHECQSRPPDHRTHQSKQPSFPRPPSPTPPSSPRTEQHLPSPRQLNPQTLLPPAIPAPKAGLPPPHPPSSTTSRPPQAPPVPPPESLQPPPHTQEPSPSPPPAFPHHPNPYNSIQNPLFPLAQPLAPDLPPLPPPSKPLPTFKPPTRRTPPPRPVRRRSPLKKSASDAAAHFAAPVIESNGGMDGKFGRRVQASGVGAGVGGDPWSEEAWDLFGIGRDGRGVGFKGFVSAREEMKERRGCGE